MTFAPPAPSTPRVRQASRSARLAAAPALCALLVAVHAGGCGHDKVLPVIGDMTGTGGSDVTGTGGAGMTGSGGAMGPVYPTDCDDIGTEPVIPPACATVSATKISSAGVPTDESTLDTALIQDAINTCPSGQSVRLAPDGTNDAFLSGPLFLRAGVTLWIDSGVTLYATRNPRDFDVRVGLCGGNDTGSGSCNALINARGIANAGVMGQGTIDGRGGEVVIGDPNNLTWWELEDAYDGALAGPRLVQTSSATNFTLYGVTLRNPTKFHVVIENTNGFVVWGITINTPPGAPNTDGVDPSASTNGVIAYNKITTGDDNIAIKGSGPPIVENIVVAHNHFGRGHGMSIGSETYGGVRNVRVCDLSLDGTQNGLRIKSDSSRGGLVQGISYSDICMRGVNNPLVFDPFYSTATGTRIPNYQAIRVKDVHVLGGGRNRLRGYDAAHPLIISLDNVVFDGAPTVTAQDAQIALGPNPVSLAPAGTNVTLTDTVTGSATPKVCDDAFVTF